MCPLCLTTAALWATGAAPAGGLAALVAARLLPNNPAAARVAAPSSMANADSPPQQPEVNHEE